MRVEVPHDVVHASCWAPASSRYWMSKRRAKFWPSSWLVPICNALPSSIIASQVMVLVAPGNRSPAVLRPTTTGIASTFTMKSS